MENWKAAAVYGEEIINKCGREDGNDIALEKEQEQEQILELLQ